MKNQNLPNSLKKLAGFAGAIGLTTLITFPAWSHLNSNMAVDNANRSQEIAQTPKPTTQPTTTTATKDIVAIASSDAQFNTLTKALTAAGLVTTLQGTGPFTVFAPTDAAFAALPKATLDDLLKPANKAKLTKILTYHVVPGSVVSTSLKSGNVKSVEGSPLKVTVAGGKVTVGGANVVKADVKASNGVIHVIDKVLIPPDAAR